MKTSHFISFVATLLLAIAIPPLHAQTPVRITANSVNLRAKPELTSEVLAQANYDERFTAAEIGDEWVKIPAPAKVDLWVMKQYVQTPQNTIGANRVNLRAGPSINYNIVDTLTLGEPVEPRGEVQDWLKIAPPPTACVWVHKDYVEVLPVETASVTEPAPDTPKKEKTTRKRKTKAETVAEAPAPETPALEESPATPETLAVTASALARPTPIISPSIPEKNEPVREIAVPPPAGLKLIPLEGQGRINEVEGKLRAAPLINEAPSRYRVVRWQNNRWQILCHVYGEAAKFRTLQDKNVRLRGREYWIQGAAAPLLVPDQIQEIPAPDSP